MMRHAISACFGLWLSSVAVQAQSYSIDWFQIAGGGGTSTGGVYSVSGSIGQPDAGPTMSSGAYSLVGGFWGVIAIQTPGAPLLSVELTNGAVRVFWPAPATGFLLDQTMALASPPAAISWSQVAPATEVPEELRCLDQGADAGNDRGQLMRHGATEHPNLAAVRSHQPDQSSQRGRLTGAVGTEKAKNVSSFHLQVQVVDRD